MVIVGWMRIRLVGGSVIVAVGDLINPTLPSMDSRLLFMLLTSVDCQGVTL